VGDSVLLLLPTEHNKLTLAWRGPYKVVGKVGNMDYTVELEPGKVKTYHINMLKQYFYRHEQDLNSNEQVRNSMGIDLQSHEGVFEQAAAIACVIEDNSKEEDTGATIKDADLLSLYNVQQKETVDEVDINPELSEVQCAELKQLLKKYKQIFSDLITVTHLVEHKVQLTQSEPVKCKMYPTSYKMQAVVDQEIDNMLAMGVIERSEDAYASPLVLVKMADGTYKVCMNFEELNKITVFDPEPMMSPDDIFPKLAGSQFTVPLIFVKDSGLYRWKRSQRTIQLL